MKIRILAFMLIIILCGVNSAFAENSAEVRALNDLLGYVYQSENIYSDVQWGLEAFKHFDSERSWENLQLARAALDIAVRDIEKLSLPEIEMTPDDKIKLMRRGIDLSFMSGNSASFKTEQTAALNACNNLKNGIMYGVFLKKDWELCMRNVILLEKITDLDIQYLANTVDWVLASINDDDISKNFNEVLEKHCPLTRAHQAKRNISKEKIEAATHEVLNQIEKLVAEMTQIIGAENDRTNFIREVLAKNDLRLLADNMLIISGMPSIIFVPKWFDNKDVHYYWQENNKIVNSPRPKTKLTRIPDVCRIKINGVKADEVKNYCQELEEAGLTPLTASSENEFIYKIKDSVFAATWDNGTANILLLEKPLCLVPRWYIPALNTLKK